MGTRELYMCSVVREDPIHYNVTFSTYKCMYVTLNSIHTYILEKRCMCRIHTCMYAKCSQTFAHIHLYVRH